MRPIESEKHYRSYRQPSSKGAAVIVRMIMSALFLLIISAGYAANKVSYISSDTISRPNGQIELMPLTPLSNVSGKSTDIGFSIKSDGKPFIIYKVEWTNGGVTHRPLEPFFFNSQTDTLPERPIIWTFNLAFPYSTRFGNNDSVCIHTDKGKLVFHQMSLEAKLQRKLATAETQLRKEKDRTSSRRMKVWLGVGIIVGLLGAVAARFYFKVRGRFAREDREIEELSLLASERRERNTELETKVDALYGERLSTLNLLCNEYFEKHDSDKLKMSFCNEVEQHIMGLRDTKSLEQLEQIVNTHQSDIIRKLREEVPDLTQKDLTFLTYIYAGFSMRAICIFSDIKPKSFYNRRLRLKERIVASDAPDKDFFISELER